MVCLMLLASECSARRVHQAVIGVMDTFERSETTSQRYEGVRDAGLYSCNTRTLV